MGQYFIGVNYDKKQWIHPHRFGDGLKFLEFSGTASGFLAGLALLLRKSSEGGGGDWLGYSSPADARAEFPVVGSWAGDSIAIVGDYDDSQAYHTAMDSYRDVSFEIMKAMATDHYARLKLKEAVQWRINPSFGDLACDSEDVALYRDVFKQPTFQERAAADPQAHAPDPWDIIKDPKSEPKKEKDNGKDV
jgi:hypothetical protein